MLDGDPLAQFTAKFACPTGIPGFPTQHNPLIPNPYDWLYNPLLMNLYGNYTAASQAAAIQQWAMLQNGGGILGPGVGATDPANNQNILNTFLQGQNSLINPFQFQMPPVIGGNQSPNSGLMQQMPQVPSMNQAATVAAAAASQMGMNMFGRYYGMMLPPQTTSSTQSNPVSPANDPQQQSSNASTTNGGNSKSSVASNLPNPSIPFPLPVPIPTPDAAFPWFNQFPTLQKVYPDLEQTQIQRVGEEDTMVVPDANNSTEPDDQTQTPAVSTHEEENENFFSGGDATNKQIETQLLEVSSGSNKISD